jgi:hypothetical protein
LIELTRDPLKEVEGQCYATVYDSERIACQRLDSEYVDDMEWKGVSLGSHRIFSFVRR